MDVGQVVGTPARTIITAVVTEFARKFEELRGARARVALACAVELTPVLGHPPTLPVVSNCLRGDCDLDGNETQLLTHGALSDMSKGEVGLLLADLVRDGFLMSLSGKHKNRVVLTASARALLERSCP